MNIESIRTLITMIHDLNKEDPDAATCLMDWARITLGRAMERDEAKRQRRKPILQPIEIRPPSLADMGINVTGCSACAVTPVNRVCPGCGNLGAAPRKPVPRKKGKRK